MSAMAILAASRGLEWGMRERGLQRNVRGGRTRTDALITGPADFTRLTNGDSTNTMEPPPKVARGTLNMYALFMLKTGE